MVEYIFSFILGNALFFIYQTQIFSYASKTLINCKKNTTSLYIIPLANTLMYGLYYLLSLPISLFYITTIFVLALEFKFISKANYMQAFSVGAIFAMHICAVHSAVIIILSALLNDVPVFFVEDNTYRFYVLFLTCGILIVVTRFILEKLISTNNVKRITTAGKYTAVLLFSTVSAVVYQSAHMALMISTEKYPQQVLVVLSTCFAVLVAFYILIMYAVEIVNASFYKRKSDDVINEQVDIEKLKTELENLMDIDELTKVYSRKYIMEVVEKMCVQGTNNFSILFADINSLKQVNDTYGHDKGDELIKTIAQCIKNSLRSKDMVGRIGGDEFLVVINSEDEYTLNIVAERIKYEVSEKNKLYEYLIAVSVGGCVVNEEMKNNGLQYVLDKADELMRQDKKNYYKNLMENEK